MHTEFWRKGNLLEKCSLERRKERWEDKFGTKEKSSEGQRGMELDHDQM
jgi:hypothetical protein